MTAHDARLGRCIDVATRGRFRTPVIPRTHVGAAPTRLPAAVLVWSAMIVPDLPEQFFAAGVRQIAYKRAASVTSRAVEYRRLAQQCLQMAPTIRDREGRAALVHMAQVWLRLAEEQEASVPPPSPIEQDRPAVQQQQQVQPKDDDKKA